MTIKKFTVTFDVDELQRQRFVSEVDLIERTEEKVLRELVAEVHKAGYEGTSWPKVGRVPMGWTNGELIVDRSNPEFWRITARVEATPRG